MRRPGVVLTAAVALFVAGRSVAADVTLVQDGQARVAVHVRPEVMAPDQEVHLYWGGYHPEFDRRKLRESVRDLALYLEKISGGSVEILQAPPQEGDERMAILVGDLAARVYGAPKKETRLKQAWRVVVSDKGLGLWGQSDESSSYAIYELLERLGCRWYMPSDMGEVIPRQRTLRLPQMDISGAPGTEGRIIWYADEAFKRRTRQGGDPFNGGHALEINENYVSKAQLEAHPEWVGKKDGKPLHNRFCWADAGLRSAVADGVIARLDKEYSRSLSIGPDDGIDFCNCAACLALDAGDMDPTMSCVSITDRLVGFGNTIAEKVYKKYPDAILAFLAYVQYTRPPVREKLHPSLAPVIAPITYCRAHAMTNPDCPSRQSLRPIVEGWGKAARNLSYYNYMFHLAEVSVPYPMITQMSAELPILYASGVNVWSPETMPSFDSNLPGMVLTVRMAVDTKAEPADILDEFFARFYGAAEKPMRRYWQVFDEAWTGVPEHAGCCFGYGRRFTPKVLGEARSAIGAAHAACETPMERARVRLCDESLKQFELFMKLRWDLFEGRLKNLDRDATAWFDRQVALGAEYAPQFAFYSVGWTPKTADGRSFTIAGQYFNIFVRPAYIDGTRIARDFKVVTPPLRKWRYRVDREKKGAELGWSAPAFDDQAWETTDPCIDTWYALGLAGFYGSVWYRDTVVLPQLGAGKKVFLWVSSTDGKCRAFVNGQAVVSVDDKGEEIEEPEGFCRPFSFDVTAAARPGAENQVTIVGTRTFLNELGTGGLLGPVLFYTER